MRPPEYDAVIVGAGPNGLAAAIVLAQTGQSVLVLEARPTVGGGMRSAGLTLPGFVHDICSAIHPLGMGSPLFSTLPLADHGLRWIQPDLPLAHPVDDGDAVAIHRSVEETAAGLGRDGRAWKRLIGPLVANWERLAPIVLGPLPTPGHALTLTPFGLRALWPAKRLAQALFREQRTRGMFAGLAAHAMIPLEDILTASFGVVLGVLAHAIGWPLPAGGSQAIPDALAGYLRALGGEIMTGFEVTSLDSLPSSRAVLLDVSPRALVGIAGDRLPSGYRRQLEGYRYGPGVFKIDYALDGPVPWRDEACRRAGTVHLGGTLGEIAAAERAVRQGRHPERPYVLVAQQSLFDPGRAPAGKHTLWAYCHVPNGSTVDMTTAIEDQIERYAPGFRDLILARHTHNTAQMQAYNPNYVGGDINNGVQDLRQLWTRPTLQRNPYEVKLTGASLPRVYLCSSATPPGGGVHGMCGYHAAKVALEHLTA